MTLPPPDPERLRETFFELAAIPSPSRRERSVADRVIAKLERLGLEVREDDAAAEVAGDTGNLVCRVPPAGEDGNTYVAAVGAHLDTVEPDGDIDPVLEGDIIHNRHGTILGADNKAAVTALLHATELLVQTDHAHPGFELFFTVAEELGVMGSRYLDTSKLQSPMAAVFDSAGPIGGIIVRAPTQQAIRAVFKGRAAHAGLEPERGRSAIQAAGRAIARMELGRLDEGTTANIGTIHGGTAANIVPERCTVEAQCRSLEEAGLARAVSEMIDALNAGATEVGVDIDIDAAVEYRAFALAPQSGVVRWARSAMDAVGVESRLLSSGGGSDANVLNEHGIPAVNLDCGMARVHTSEEHVALSDLARLTTVVLELIQQAPGYGRNRKKEQDGSAEGS